MDDLIGRIERVSQDNIPELIATDDLQFALQEFRQGQLRSLLDTTPAERRARASDLLALRAR